MQENYPQKPGLDFILKQAFFYWNKTLLYQILFTIIYGTIFFAVSFYIMQRFGIYDQYAEALADYSKVGISGLEELNEKLAAIRNTENFAYALYGFMAVSAFLFPMNLGFFQIFKKIDLKEEIGIGDLFVGYNGINFFRYVSYFVFWYLVCEILKITLILPLFWIMITILVAPLMFFHNKTTFEAISLNWKAFKMYFLEILVCTIVAVLFKYIGFALFFVGALLTFPFWNAMIYSLYKTIFNEKS